MDDLLSEKEQLDQIRSWWSEYGWYIIGGIVLGAGLLYGINKYQSQQLAMQEAASTAFEALLVQIDGGDLDAAEASASEILTDYGDTTYAGQTGLAMARLYMDKNRDQDAADTLSGVVKGDADDELKHVARLRLGRILLYQDKAQEAVDLLADIDGGAFNAAYGEVLGDAYASLGRVAEAQDAYQKVMLDPMSQGTVDPQLVQWKSLDLPELETETTEPEPAPPVEAAEETEETDGASVEGSE